MWFYTTFTSSQEPGGAEEITELCQINYCVSFPMMAKVDANGDNAHPIYKWLKSQNKGTLTDAIKWNCGKFLVNKDGKVVKRCTPKTKLADVAKDTIAIL